MALTDQVIMPGSDYQAICDATRSLTGETGTLKSGDIANKVLSGKKNLYILQSDDSITVPTSSVIYDVNFIVNKVASTQCKQIKFVVTSSTNANMYYVTTAGEEKLVYQISDGVGIWGNMNYRYITVLGEPGNEIKTWLANNCKSSSDELKAIEPDENNIRVTALNQIIEPDDGIYDAMSRVVINKVFDKAVYVFNDYTQDTPAKTQVAWVKALNSADLTLPLVGNILFRTAYSSIDYYSKITVNTDGIKYNDTLVFDPTSTTPWKDQKYRKVIVEQQDVEDKNTADIFHYIGDGYGSTPNENNAVEELKDVTIKSNGSYSITPDTPYDGIITVEIDVNVPGVDLPFTKYSTVTTTDGTLSFTSSILYYSLCVRNSSSMLVAVIDKENMNAYALTEGSAISFSDTVLKITYNSTTKLYTYTWNIASSSSSSFYEGSMGIYVFGS